jgi:hypothetical protein
MRKGVVLLFVFYISAWFCTKRCYFRDLTTLNNANRSLWLSAFKTVVSHKFRLRRNLSIYCNPCRRTVNFFKTQSYKEALYPVTITSGESIDLGVILLEEDQFSDQQNTVVRLFENDLTDDNSGSESTSTIF